MGGSWFWFLAFAVAIVGVIFLLWRPLRSLWQGSRFTKARRNFHRQRERLEVKFVQLVSSSSAGGPGRWVDCRFEDDVAYVRNRNTGELSAFVGVVLIGPSSEPLTQFSGTPDVQAATAVFRFDGRRWETDGRALLNLTPDEAVRFYRNELEMIEQELAGHA